jgi:hypothetical protein
MLYPAELRGYEKNGADDRELWEGFQAQMRKKDIKRIIPAKQVNRKSMLYR